MELTTQAMSVPDTIPYIIIGVLLIISAISSSIYLILRSRRKAKEYKRSYETAHAEDVAFAFGLVTFIVGGFLALIVFAMQPTTVDAAVLKEDITEQLQIEEVQVPDNGSHWFIGKDDNGQFVRFSLVEKENVEDTYLVLIDGDA